MSLRVAVVHDYLTQRGGAERVALVIRRAFPGARMITSVYEADATFPGFRETAVETSYLQRYAALRRDPRRALPLLAAAYERLRVDDVDVVVCSTSGWAHGISTSAPKVVYCHNPARWLYQPDDYGRKQPLPVRAAMRTLRRPLTTWDRRAAHGATRYLANSSVVRDRVLATYGIEAGVVPPPVGIAPDAAQAPVPGVEAGFFLVVGRARGYKNADVVIDAFRRLPDERLVVVGGTAGVDDVPPNVIGVVDVPDSQLRWLYAHCRALVAVAHEDFGLTPLEGNAFGRPALVLRAGGFLDTLDEGVSGLFIQAVDAGAVVDAVQESLRTAFDEQRIRRHADRYSVEAFSAALRREVEAAAEGQSGDRPRHHR